MDIFWLLLLYLYKHPIIYCEKKQTVNTLYKAVNFKMISYWWIQQNMTQYLSQHTLGHTSLSVNTDSW